MHNQALATSLCIISFVIEIVWIQFDRVSQFKFLNYDEKTLCILLWQGSAVETEQCGGTNNWDCIYGATGSFLEPDQPAERPGIIADIGADCRCGCIIHLTMSKPRRIIAATPESCPGRTFWLLQAEAGHRIRLVFDYFRLICSTQYIRIRDGDSLVAELIAEFSGGSAKNSEPIVSSGTRLLLEFYSNELSTIGQSCKGAFRTHAQQMRKYFLRELSEKGRNHINHFILLFNRNNDAIRSDHAADK